MQLSFHARIYGSIASTLIIIGAIIGAVYFHRIYNNVQTKHKIIVPGVEYEYRTQYYPYPLAIHLLKVDPSKISIGLALGGEQLVRTEKLSSITQRHNALAGVNAGFFTSAVGTDGKNKHDERYDGVPVGSLKIDGVWCKEPIPEQVNLGWTYQAQEPLIGNFVTRWELNLGNQAYPIDHLNHWQEESCAILYTSKFHATTLTSNPCCETTILRGKVTNNAYYTTNNTIPRRGYVYALGPKSLVDPTMIQPGQSAKLSLQISPLSSAQNQQNASSQDWKSMDFIVGGYGTLVKNGNHCLTHTLVEECQDESFVSSRIARTAVGIMPNGDWLFVVVEGSVPNVSVGISLPELGEFMEKKGCTTALNLSGSSSSTLFVDGILKNMPTVPRKYGLEIEGGEQPIGSAFILKPRSIKRLGDILIDLKYITAQQLAYAAKESLAQDQALGQFLLEQGLIKENQLEDALEMKRRLNQYA